MKNRAFVTFVCCFIAGLLGTIETAQAAPDGSQRLRGLSDRVFLVNVEVVADPGCFFPPGFVFPNCYFFNADGSWVDPGFPVAGTWLQDSVGVKTGYSATADAGGGLVLIQEGLVTPADGGGVLQITAYSTAVIFGLEFLSVGFEVEGCPL